MNSKKGFTLVEIIVSLVLIILIATSAIVLTVTNNKNKEKRIEEVTLQIKEAAGVYLAVNKEINANIEQNILNGGSGYVIPLKTLLEEGYIGDNHIKTLEDNGVKINLSKDYMLAAVFSNSNHCDNNESTITIKANYELEKNGNYYLCNFVAEKKYLLYDLDGGKFTDDSTIISLYPKDSIVKLKEISSNEINKASVLNIKYKFKGWNSEKNCAGDMLTGDYELKNDTIIYACYEEEVLPKTSTFKEVMSNSKFTNNYDKIAVSEEWCKNNPGYDSDKIVCNENGIYTHYDRESNIVYYFSRGAIKNNYLKFNDQMWRILWVSSENKMKLVLDNEINIKINDNIDVIKDDTLYYHENTKLCHNEITQKDYDDITGTCRNTATKSFWYLASNDAEEEYKRIDSNTSTENYQTIRLTYDYSKSIKINEPNLYKYTCRLNSNYCYNSNYAYDGVYDSSKNIYYKTMVNSLPDLNKYNYVDDSSSFCSGNEYSTEDWKWQDNIGTCTKKSGLSDYKVTYITLGEITRAGLGSLFNSSFSDEYLSASDNFLLPKNKNQAYFIQDFIEEWGQYDNWYFSVSSKGVEKSNVFDREYVTYDYYKYSPYTGKNTSLTYYVYYKNANELCGYNYCKSGLTIYEINNATNSYEDIYKNLNIYYFKFAANAVKPAIIIDLNKVDLSNNNGTLSDPYTLI